PAARMIRVPRPSVEGARSRDGAGSEDATSAAPPIEPASPGELAAAISVLVGATAALLVAVAADGGVRSGFARLGPYVPLGAFVLVVVVAVAQGAVVVSSPARRLAAWVRRAPLLVDTVALIGSVLAFLALLLSSWTTPPASALAIGGTLPWGDSILYFGGGERLLMYGHLDAYNSRRPLNAMFNADRLAVTGLNLRASLVIQAVLLGVACFLAARAVARRLGPAAGFALFATLIAVTSLFVATNMSEVLAVVLGALGFAAMWQAISTRQASLALWGIALLALAMAARPGPVLVLILIPLWFAYYLRGSLRLNWRLLGAAAAIVAGSAVLGYVLVPLFGGDSGNVNGNSSLIVYGMARGFPGWSDQVGSWRQIFVDYPQLANKPDVVVNKFAQTKAREEVIGHPVRFAVSAVKSAKNYVWIAKDEILGWIHSRFLRLAGLSIAAVLALVVLVRRWRTSRAGTLIDATLFIGLLAAVPVIVQDWPPFYHRPSWIAAAIAAVGYLGFVVRGTDHLHARSYEAFTIAGLAGFLLSMPFLGVDTTRVFISAAAVLGVLLALAVASLTTPARTHLIDASSEGHRLVAVPRRSAWAPALLGVVLVVVLFVGTPVAMALVSRPALSTPRCPGGAPAQPLIGGVAVAVVRDTNAATRPLTAVDAGTYRRNSVVFYPITAVLDRARALPFTVLDGLTADGNDRIAFVPGIVGAPQHGVTYLCGATIHDPSAQILLQFWPQAFDFFQARSVVRPTR
ncbi:MAG TPA: hypothetical protein VGU73_12640, partial [Acidimicrobiia bacterium]|nr:hypothetical protein [Acidimicrobiia bacterium]